MKIKRFLGFIALAVAIILPMNAKAASYQMSFEKTTETDEYFEVTIKATQDTAGTLKAGAYTATMTVQPGAQYVENSAVGSGNWTVMVTGNTVMMTLSVDQTELETVVGTLRFNKVSTENCDVQFECKGKTTTVTPAQNPTPENPKTGNVLPYAVIAGGVLIAGAVYYVTRKNNKLYNI